MVKSRRSNALLYNCIDVMHTFIKNKDKEQIFMYPVTDAIAEGYSKIIKNPMCFLFMQRKIENHMYISIFQYLCDLKLTLENAMVYNHPETIYHKKAKDLLQIAHEKFNRSKIAAFVAKMNPENINLTPEQYGFVGEHHEPNIFLHSELNSHLKSKSYIQEPKNLMNDIDESKPIVDPVTAAVLNNISLPSIGYLMDTQSGETKFKFIHPAGYLHSKTLQKNFSYNHAENVIKAKKAVYQDFNKFIKLLKKNQNITFGPSYESINTHLSPDQTQDLLNYALEKQDLLKPHNKFEGFSSKFKAFTKNIDDVSMSIIMRALRKDSNICESNDQNENQSNKIDCKNLVYGFQTDKKIQKVTGGTENANFLNGLTTDLLQADKMTHEQYTAEKKSFKPYMSEDQDLLLESIANNLASLINTAKPKDLLPKNFSARDKLDSNFKKSE